MSHYKNNNNNLKKQTSNLIQKDFKYPKYVKLKKDTDKLTEAELNQINKYSENFELEAKTISIADLKQSLLSLGMDKNSPSFFKITNNLSTQEFLENGIPFEILQKTFEEHLGLGEEKAEIRKIFDLFKSNEEQDFLSVNDLKKVMTHINIEFDEEELKNMMKECSQAGSEFFSFEDFYLLMTTRDK